MEERQREALEELLPTELGQVVASQEGLENSIRDIEKQRGPQARPAAFRPPAMLKRVSASHLDPHVNLQRTAKWKRENSALCHTCTTRALMAGLEQQPPFRVIRVELPGSQRHWLWVAACCIDARARHRCRAAHKACLFQT